MDQKQARDNATEWSNTLKKHLLATLGDICKYDNTFKNYYNVLIEATDANDGETLKEGIRDLQEDIKKKSTKCRYINTRINHI
ncbi:HBL/NHE enterotoxin family protein [Bacillus thuringiensis]